MTDNCKKCWGNKYYEGKECRECLGTGSEKERLRIKSNNKYNGKKKNIQWKCDGSQKII